MDPKLMDKQAVDKASEWLSALADGGEIRLTSETSGLLASLIDEARKALTLQDNISAWLRARAEIAINSPADPEQPMHEELAQGWRQGSYNSLHAAANAVERGEALLPPDQWPSYLQRGRPTVDGRS